MLKKFNALIYVSLTCSTYLIEFQYFWLGRVDYSACSYYTPSNVPAK